MRISDWMGSFVRADVRLSEIRPYSAAGSDSYDLIDRMPPATWARLAAWNAFVLQVYADCLVAAGSNARYVTTDIAVFARHLYALASIWVKEARKAEASDTYRFEFRLPHRLPQWGEAVRTDDQLAGMRSTLDTARTRAASDLERFAGDASQQTLLRVRLVQIDAEAEYTARLWTPKPSFELRCSLSAELTAALDHAYELGHLLAQPELLDRRP